MTFDDFKQQIGRLSSVYGDRHYPIERSEQIWNRFKFANINLFTEVVDELIADSAHAPMLSKFVDAYRMVKSRHPEISNDPYQSLRDKFDHLRSTVDCRFCKVSGIIEAIKINDPCNYNHDFLCTCEIGKVAAKLPENRILIAYNFSDPLFFYSTHERIDEIIKNNLNSITKLNGKKSDFSVIEKIIKEKNIDSLKSLANI